MNEVTNNFNFGLCTTGLTWKKPNNNNNIAARGFRDISINRTGVKFHWSVVKLH